jgi:hypothetical protein
MKLNLLPKTVDTVSRSKRAFVGSLLTFIVAGVASFLMAKVSQDRLTSATAAMEEAKPPYDKVVSNAKAADDLVAKPEVKQVVANTALAQAMIKANALYPDLYDSVKPYIPGFFRITSLNAQAAEAGCTVNMTGTVKTAQEYSDLVLALLRIPGATSVTRGGFISDDVRVPALSEVDQNGRPRKASATVIPDDPLERLAYFESNVEPTGYFNSGNFGTTEAGTEKTVRPGESQITVSVTLPKDIRTPDPRATIASLPAGSVPLPTATPAAGAIPSGAPGGLPAGRGGRPGGAGDN